MPDGKAFLNPAIHNMGNTLRTVIVSLNNSQFQGVCHYLRSVVRFAGNNIATGGLYMIGGG